MMTQAFYTGISGLKSNQSAIDITANNLANISTVGFRGYNAEFTTLFEKELVTSSSNSSSKNLIGSGSRVNGSSMDTALGDVLLSDTNTDLAIVGNGWFGLAGESEALYTRAGNFTFDKESSLVTPDGHYVLGTMGGNIKDGELTEILDEVILGDVAKQTALSFPKTLLHPPVPTTISKFYGNIGREDVPRSIGASAIDAQNNKNYINLSFTLTQPQVLPGTQWDLVATAKNLDGDIIYDTQNGQVKFDEQGGLISSSVNTINNNGVIVELDLGRDFDGVTSVSNSPISASSKSDGTIGGDLVGYEINENAEVLATFTNGYQSSVGKIAVYHFRNEQGLERITGTRFQESSNSGKAIFFKDATGQNVIGANVVNFKLEGSNYDMTHGLTELIILQRAYDASSKSITTADEMMQKALSMDA